MKIRQLIKKYMNKKRKDIETGWIDITKERPPNNTKILVYGKIIRELREGDIEYGQCVVNSGNSDDDIYDNNVFSSRCSDFYVVQCLASHWRIINDPKNTELWYAN